MSAGPIFATAPVMSIPAAGSGGLPSERTGGGAGNNAVQITTNSNNNVISGNAINTTTPTTPTTSITSFSHAITTRPSDAYISTSVTVKRANSDDSKTQPKDKTAAELSSKRIKLETTVRRKHVLDFFQAAYRRRRDQYVDHVLELFFLEQQGNLMDFYGWRKRAPTLPMLHYLRNFAQDDASEFEQLQLDKARLDSIGPSGVRIIPLTQLGQPLPSVPQTPGTSFVGTPLAAASTLGSSASTPTAGNSSFAGTSATTFTPSSSTAGSTPVGASDRDASSFSVIGAVVAGGGSKTRTPLVQHISQPTSSTLASSTSAVQTPTSLNTLSIDKNAHHHVTTPSHPLRPHSGLTSSHRSSVAHHHHTSAGHHHRLSTPIPSKLSAHRYAHSSTLSHVSSSVRGTPHATGRSSISSAYESSIGSQEQIVERAKQEAHVMQRVAELRREGLWSCKRLPKVQEPPREKAHWDYLLEEMEWMSTDFAQERKWKKAAAKKCARMIMRYHMDKQQQVDKQEREEQQRIRKIASNIAKEIRSFWNNVEKLVEFKMQTKLEEKRKKALDIHLNFIVDQTEKFSSWLTEGLTEGLNKSEVNTAQNSVDSSPMLCGSEVNDNEFQPSAQMETDDEETIAKEEAEVGLVSEHNELDLLRKESAIPLDELLSSLPPNVLENVASCSLRDDDVEFTAKSDEEMEDEEDTIAEQEQNENDDENQAELEALEDEANMPVEKLLELYCGAFDSQQGEEDGEDVTTESAAFTEQMSDDELTEIDEETDDEDEEILTDEKSNSPEIGVEFLINPDSEQTIKVILFFLFDQVILFLFLCSLDLDCMF